MGLAFFPFVSPLPIGTDVQPTFFLAAMLSIAVWGLNYRIGKIDLLFIFMILLTIFHQASVDSPIVSGLFRFAFAYIAFIFFMVFMHKISARFIFLLALFHFCCLVINFIAPSQFAFIAELFIRAFKVTSIGVRGASGFSPEPGFAGAIAVCLLAAAFAVRDARGPSRYFLATVVLSVISVALTRSGTGSLLLVGFLTIYYFKPHPKNVLVFAALLVAGMYVAANVNLGRGTDALRLIAQSPVEAFLSDRSMGARVLSALVSVFTIFEHPLGNGVGSFDDASLALAQQYNLYRFAEGSESGKVGNLSMLALYSVELGLPWLIFLATFFVWGLRKSGITAAPYLFLSFYFILTTFSLAFPPTWFFFCLSINSCKLPKYLGTAPKESRIIT